MENRKFIAKRKILNPEKKTFLFLMCKYIRRVVYTLVGIILQFGYFWFGAKSTDLDYSFYRGRHFGGRQIYKEEKKTVQTPVDTFNHLKVNLNEIKKKF